VPPAARITAAGGPRPRTGRQHQPGRPLPAIPTPSTAPLGTCYIPGFLQGTHMGRAMKRLWPPQAANPQADT